MEKDTRLNPEQSHFVKHAMDMCDQIYSIIYKMKQRHAISMQLYDKLLPEYATWDMETLIKIHSAFFAFLEDAGVNCNHKLFEKKVDEIIGSLKKIT